MKTKKGEIRVLDLFAGAGGFGLGFKLANKRYRLVCSLEIDKWAVKTLEANNSDDQKIIHNDIKKFRTKKEILSICPKKPNIIIGGPPCQGFSIAGPTKDPKDPRNSLFKNFAKWVKILGPKVFIIENVRGILNRRNEKGEKVIDIIKSTFIKLGYTVAIWELNAAHYGVPQNRERVFIIGNNVGQTISEPVITHYIPKEYKSKGSIPTNLKKAITVIQAISDLPKLKANEGNEISIITSKPKNNYQKNVRDKNGWLYNHVAMAHSTRVVERYKQILSGISINDISHELKIRKRNGNGTISSSPYHSNYRHLKPNMISYTIPASFYSNFIHPKQPRNITSREAARLQSFPDNYIFKGKRTQISSKLLGQLGKTDENHLSQYNQVGNAVPPLLAKAIAERVLEFFD